MADDPALIMAEAQEAAADAQAMATAQAARVDSGASVNYAFAHPQQQAGNRYQAHFGRDHPLSNLPTKDLLVWVDLFRLYDSIIADAVAMDNPQTHVGQEFANLIAAEKMSIMETTRASGGFERIMQNTLRQELHKSKTNEPSLYKP